MKEVKCVLRFLFYSSLTSSWWAAILWGHLYEFLWVIPVVGSIVLLVPTIGYIVQHWRDDRPKTTQARPVAAAD
jgi:hypothetical protein